MNALPEVWAGLEGTVHRIGERFFDQCTRSRHYARAEDLDAFAALGVRALRYPVLWEVVDPGGRANRFAYAHDRLNRLRELGVRSIAGLVHHGSGPRHTNLLQDDFAEGLAKYARALAEREPWLLDYTPVNEPLTTARFSCLYGIWYPHERAYAPFARALVVQCRAVVLAMRAIREVNPRARLIQTEDVGVTYSTPELAYQADFQNEQRWLSFDLLCGRVDESHALYDMLRSHGVRADELEFFREHPTPPDVLGINYYVTSDRVLDQRRHAYPSRTHGGNLRDAYADVEAVRAWPAGIAGHEAILASAWERYGIPVALTEVHLGCTREEQMRWLHEAWRAATDLSRRGVAVRAVTVWSLLGAFDWNSLLTRDVGHYEVGAYDVRGERPRPTALAHMTSGLATRASFEHPVLVEPGWWRRPDRIDCGAFAATVSAPEPRPEPYLLVLGATGTLGRAFQRVCAGRGLSHRLLSRSEMDLTSDASVEAALARYRPWAVINATGYVRVDDAEQDPAQCFRDNTDAALRLARACAKNGVRLVTFSSDLVFGGERRAPYVESDAPNPLNVYGKSKLEAERSVLAVLPRALVVRTSAFFGPWDAYNFLHHALTAAGRGETFAAASDVVVSPTYVVDLAHACLDLLIDEEDGVWHLTNPSALSWAELARKGIELAGLDSRVVAATPASALGMRAPRPAYSALGSERGALLPGLEDALRRFIAERAAS